MDLKEMLSDESTTKHNSNEKIISIDFLRKPKLGVREFGRIEVNKEKKSISYIFVRLPVFKDIIMLEGELEEEENMSDKMPVWFKEKLNIAKTYIEKEPQGQ